MAVLELGDQPFFSDKNRAFWNLHSAGWGGAALVRSASNHGGPFPRVSIWQGTTDGTVNPQDQRELVDQWTNVLGIDQVPDSEDRINGQAHKQYKDSNGKTLVETVLINGAYFLRVFPLKFAVPCRPI